MGAVGNKTLFDCLPLPPPSPFDLIRGVSWSLAALSPPLFSSCPPHTIPHWDSFQLPRYILRMASNLEVVSVTADIGQQQWSCTFFRLSDRTLISRVKNFVIWQESVGKGPSIKAGQPEPSPHWRLHARFITSTRIWTRAHQPEQEEVSSWRFRRA